MAVLKKIDTKADKATKAKHTADLKEQRLKSEADQVLQSTAFCHPADYLSGEYIDLEQAMYEHLAKELSFYDVTTEYRGGEVINFQQNQIVQDRCWQADNKITYGEGQIADRIAELRQKSRENMGSEVNDLNIQRMMNTITKFERQLDLWRLTFDAANRHHEHLKGVPWSKPAKRSNMEANKAKTFTSTEMDEMLARYNEEPVSDEVLPAEETADAVPVAV
jgi:DNA repair exonuclease SbcCD nuclease subunit